MVDKYGTGQDPYCYPGTTVLRNRLGLLDDDALNEAERSLSEIAASEIEFSPPPYDLPALQRILFEHLIINNAGYEISWWPVEEGEWLQANIDAVVCDYRALIRIFDRCIGQPIA
ncbi:hypothetical protein [Pseudomonas sp. LFM046]|uniref:hypothetical protein n=1 Tax=Pseudomonas sp. LFM046 TaxID=1608357 RepID=UPI0005CF9D4C|nr:hypothetical protein [Pseudomonas sp. LFM046]